MSKQEQHWKSAFRQSGIILRNYDILSSLGRSQSTGAENFSSYMYLCYNYTSLVRPVVDNVQFTLVSSCQSRIPRNSHIHKAQVFNSLKHDLVRIHTTDLL